MACKEENMAKKTNKTSHVLNLITGGSGDPEPDARQTQDPMQTEQNVVVVDPEEEERIAEDIRRQLLKEMGGDMPAPEQAAPAPEEESQETEDVIEAVTDRAGDEALETQLLVEFHAHRVVAREGRRRRAFAKEREYVHSFVRE